MYRATVVGGAFQEWAGHQWRVWAGVEQMKACWASGSQRAALHLRGLSTSTQGPVGAPCSLEKVTGRPSAHIGPAGPSERPGGREEAESEWGNLSQSNDMGKEITSTC